MSLCWVRRTSLSVSPFLCNVILFWQSHPYCVNPSCIGSWLHGVSKNNRDTLNPNADSIIPGKLGLGTFRQIQANGNLHGSMDTIIQSQSPLRKVVTDLQRVGMCYGRQDTISECDTDTVRRINGELFSKLTIRVWWNGTVGSLLSTGK